MMIAQLKEQLEKEKANTKVANDKNEGLLLQKAEMLHKITQLRDKVKEKEQEADSTKAEHRELKNKYDELISLQYANESEKLKTLVQELDNKQEEINTIAEEK